MKSPLVKGHGVEPFREFIARVSPGLNFDHLDPLIKLVERAQTEQVYAVVSTPPQHGKSTFFYHALSWFLKQGRSNVYCTYAQPVSNYHARKIRKIADAAEVEFENDNIESWIAANGGELLVTSIKGQATSRPLSGLAVLDDPHKDFADAQSVVMRDRVFDWLEGALMTREHPGASIIVVQTRWHLDDLYGRMKDRGWESINLPAISDEGRALWPSHRPIEWLKAHRDGDGVRQGMSDYMWSALYMGAPRPRGQELFGPPHFYEAAPRGGYSLAIGVDLAYTSKTRADWSTAVVLARAGENFYVLDMVRRQCQAPEFAAHLKALQTIYPNAPTLAYVAGTEQGALDFFARSGVHVKGIPAVRDKFVRAQDMSAAWNKGRVLIPRTNNPWTADLVRELTSFTGVNDKNDDIVDGLVAAYDHLAAGGGRAPKIDVVRRAHTSGLRKGW